MLSRSSWFKVLSGKPQGSILRPLLFLSFLYADDSKLYKIIQNTSDRKKMQPITNLIKIKTLFSVPMDEILWAKDDLLRERGQSLNSIFC